MKFVQFIEYNIKITFLEKSCRKCVWQISSIPFSKSWKLSIYVDQQSEYLYSLLLWFVQDTNYLNILKLSCRPFSFTSYKVFLKNKKRSGTSFVTSFSLLFLRKFISHVIVCFIVWLSLLLEILGNINIVIVCFPLWDIVSFKINLGLPIKTFFYFYHL